MNVARNKIVSIHYTVTDVEGIIVDTNTDFEPLEYLHGAGNILPALELLLEQASANELRQVTIAATNMHFKVWIRNIRQATAKELLTGQPQKIEAGCGPDCLCYNT